MRLSGNITGIVFEHLKRMKREYQCVSYICTIRLIIMEHRKFKKIIDLMLEGEKK